MRGGRVHAPCINRSFDVNCIYGRDIFLGFMCLKELEGRVIERILAARQKEGLFTSLEDFLDRVPVSIEQLSILVRIDAFRFTGNNPHELLWQAHLYLSRGTLSGHPKLFPPKQRNFRIPELHTTALETAFTQLELLGFCLCSPFELLKETPKNTNGSKDLQDYLDRHIDIYGYLVTVKNTHTHKGDRMHFATLTDQQGEVFDTVLFPPVAAKYPFRGKGIYRFYGKVVSEFGFLSIEVVKMQKLDYIQDPRYVEMKAGKRMRFSGEMRKDPVEDI
jgi:DNA polymerase-3 subunit alpha